MACNRCGSGRVSVVPANRRKIKSKRAAIQSQPIAFSAFSHSGYDNGQGET